MPSRKVSGTAAALGDAVTGPALNDEMTGLIGFDRDCMATADMAAPSANLSPMPRSVSHEEAVTLPLAALTTRQTVVDYAVPELGEQVLVQTRCRRAVASNSPCPSR